jgi:3'(2'), 5'-bisphosphate nucleotidase
MHALVVTTSLSGVWSRLTAELLPILSAYRAQLADLDVAVKADDTLLSEADVAVQERVVALISEYEPTARIIAEEGSVRLDEGSGACGRVWVIDPIDGTAEFVKPAGREFCTVVALLSDGIPDACYVLAPELGEGRSPVVISLDGGGALPKVNGEPARTAQIAGLPVAASATRSASRPARGFEAVAEQRGIRLKTRTTSQTLDMTRTCLDLRGATGLGSFAWFYRERQKLWDGVAGIALASATGRSAVDRGGSALAPIGSQVLEDSEPTFATTVITIRSEVQDVLSLLDTSS